VNFIFNKISYYYYYSIENALDFLEYNLTNLYNQLHAYLFTFQSVYWIPRLLHADKYLSKFFTSNWRLNRAVGCRLPGLMSVWEAEFQSVRFPALSKASNHKYRCLGHFTIRPTIFHYQSGITILRGLTLHNTRWTIPSPLWLCKLRNVISRSQIQNTNTAYKLCRKTTHKYIHITYSSTTHSHAYMYTLVTIISVGTFPYFSEEKI
jgi:hypothetical protein